MTEQLHLWPEITPEVRIGDIVTPKDEFYPPGRTGEIVEICHDGDVDGPIGVLFSKLSDMIGYLGDSLVVRFCQEDLIRLDDWPIQELSRILFGSSFHQYCDPGPEFRKEICQHPGCEERALDTWTLVNYWGTVYPLSYCLGHADKYHGKCVESIEVKK